MHFKSLLLSTTLGLSALSAQAVTAYSQDFESGPLGTEWSGAGTIQGSQGLSAFGFGQLHLKNDGSSTTQLNLTGLAAHTTMTLSFSLAIWDSADLGDLFQVAVDGNFLFNSTDFGNYYPGDNISHGPGVHITAPFTDFNTPNYGYNSYHDAAQTVSFTFAHSASTMQFNIQYPSSQGAPDEAFGIDNVMVVTNAVPEPGTYAMMAAGLGLLGLARRRRS
ncbi:MAG: PEP-CTERM sorting domain-containing protein [Burkholderiaceae bacterium]|nr:PEP-CTERM sorting domain-containing protein [Burkholderiaceae bacterium]MBT9503915.1 PEP-CTERM sorting domain-containing protein [Burkholderiaceae bacterium]